MSLPIDNVLQNITTKIVALWNKPTHFCHELNYTSLEADPKFTSNWLQKRIIGEHARAKNEIERLRREMSQLLRTEDSENKRGKRAVVAAGIAAASVFGAGIGLGSQVGC